MVSETSAWGTKNGLDGQGGTVRIFTRFARRVRALLRHYVIAMVKYLAPLSDYSVGYLALIRWVPRLAANRKDLCVSASRNVSKKQAQVTLDLANLHGYYINLESRGDRREMVERELDAIGLSGLARFSAVRSPLGALGCAQSHIAVLQRVRKSGQKLALICEDDVQFLASKEDLETAITEFSNNQALDVLCLAFKLRAPKLRVSDRLSIANSIQTTSCYVVKSTALDPLIRSFRESETMLLDGIPPRVAAIDMNWKKLQTKHLTFSVTSVRSARQRPSFSDVAGRHKDYGA